MDITMKPLWLFPFFFILVIGSFSYPFSKPSKADTLSTPLTVTSPLQSNQAQSIYLANKHNKFHGAVLTNGLGTKREVALTFDDAPDPIYTPKILDILKNKGVKATFFLVGKRVQAHPEIVKRMVQEGHIIGNHSYSHAKLTNLNNGAFHKQIMKTDQLIKKITGYSPAIVRPPYGAVTLPQIKWLVSQHKKIVNWNVDSLDWKGLKADQVETNVITHVHPGSIILQHSGTGNGGDLSGTVNALPKIIDELRNEGYKIVTVPQLLGIHDK